eukprot:424897_1
MSSRKAKKKPANSNSEESRCTELSSMRISTLKKKLKQRIAQAKLTKQEQTAHYKQIKTFVEKKDFVTAIIKLERNHNNSNVKPTSDEKSKIQNKQPKDKINPNKSTVNTKSNERKDHSVEFVNNNNTTDKKKIKVKSTPKISPKTQEKLAKRIAKRKNNNTFSQVNFEAKTETLNAKIEYKKCAIQVASMQDLWPNDRLPDSLNEHAIISPETLTQLNKDGFRLHTGFLVIENMRNKEFCDIIGLIEMDDAKPNRIYINHTVMTNVKININNKVNIYNIHAANNKWRIAKTIKLSRYEDGESYASAVILRQYLNPYFMPKRTVKYDTKEKLTILKRGNDIFIHNKKFRIDNFTLKYDEENEYENQFKFGMVNSDTIIEIDDKPIPKIKDKRGKSLKLKVMGISDVNLINTNRYNTTAVIAKSVSNQLKIVSGDIIFIKGKKGKLCYCRIDTIKDDDIKNDYDIINDDDYIYMNYVMQKNLRVTTNDEESDYVHISVNRTCKQMVNKFASEIFVIPVLGDDIDDNNDYNDVDTLKKCYLEPYFYNYKKENDIVIGENYIFSACHKDFPDKKIEFIVDEVDCDEDEDCNNCIVNCKTKIECDPDGIDKHDVYNFDECGYSDIGNCQTQIDKMKDIIDLSLRNSSILYGIGQKPTSGVLLYGAPGTGKTLLAKAIASEEGLTMYPMNAPDIVSSEIGESERKLKKAFKYVSNNSPGIIFIDEIDSILCYHNIKSALVS